MKIVFETAANNKPLITGVRDNGDTVVVVDGSKKERLEFLEKIKKHNNLDFAFFLSYEDQMEIIRQGNGKIVLRKNN